MKVEVDLTFSSLGLVNVSDVANKVCAELRFLLHRTQFPKVNDVLQSLLQLALAPPLSSMNRPQVERAAILITESSGATHWGARSIDDFQCGKEDSVFGTVDILYETKECGVYRLIVEAGKSIPTHVHNTLEEHELVLSEGFLLQGQPIAAGRAFSWPQKVPHRYDNQTSEAQVILCIDLPAFYPEDEVVVPVPREDLVPISIIMKVFDEFWTVYRHWSHVGNWVGYSDATTRAWETSHLLWASSL